MNDRIRHLKRSDLDHTKWNDCLQRSANGLIYAYTFYLDRLCPGWEALVLGDYECIMPLIRKSKFGVRYIYEPPFIQRLGVFGSVDEKVLHEFYSRATEYARYIDCHVSGRAGVNGMNWTERVNFILPLNRSYQEIRKNYSEECETNIRKAVNRKCVFEDNLPVSDVIGLYRTTYGLYHPHVSSKDYEHLLQAASDALEKGMLFSCGVKDGENGTPIFGALLFHCNKRIYYSVAAPSKAGRIARAGYFFIDEVIRRHAGLGLLFDFEGSDIPNVAAFYKRFGPVSETYYQVRYNNLPWPFSLLKK